MNDAAINAGVGAQTGFALQRNAAIYILLNNYHTRFISTNYFICLEHHDDFVFCFLDDHGHAKAVEAYQSKKKSNDRWTVTVEFAEILCKLLRTGIAVRQDALRKSNEYTQKLHFTSNSSIFLESKIKGASSNTENVTVDETRTLVTFNELDPIIQKLIVEKIESCPTYDVTTVNEYKNLHFLFIELNRSAKEQRNLLAGKLGEVFGDTIYDQLAAIDTIFSLFEKVELIYNQGGASFLDESKRVSGQQVADALKVITSKSKAFDYWRSEKKAISKRLNIRPHERDGFESIFVASFDLFKSLTEAEHQKILKFTNENYKDCISTNEEDCVIELFDLFKKTRSTHFMDDELKPILYAAYFQVNQKCKGTT